MEVIYILLPRRLLYNYSRKLNIPEKGGGEVVEVQSITVPLMKKIMSSVWNCM
jgi:hypothetical protein